ncbi:hypothetical protein ABW20_dc0101695 [Dactylellina cionopaga]|nr:hypothetical protein ABW20_dc0101695 [Dactylellina cionopaga]
MASYQHVPLQLGQQSGNQSPDGRSSRAKTSIFKSEDHRLKHSILRGSTPKKIAITGHFLRSIALRLAERGTTLETLEQLTRSVTISSTITTPYLLNSYNFLTGVLLCLWAVSPLGGQASLRILRTVFVEVKSDVAVNYLNPFNQTSYFQGGGANIGPGGLEISSIYVSSLLSPAEVKNSPVDSWRNVKIPLLEYLEGNPAVARQDGGWYDVPRSNTAYSSLLGNPTSGFAPNSTAILQSGYCTIECSFLELINPDLCDDGKSTDCFNASNPRVPDWVFPGAGTDGQAMLIGYNTTQTNLNLTRDHRTTPMDIIIQSRGDGGMSAGHCVLSQTYVETQIDCLNSACRASKIRRLDEGPKRPPLFIDNPDSTISIFFTSFAKVAPPSHEANSNPSQLYILYPENPLSMSGEWLDVAKAGKNIFGIRMTQLMNTFLSSSYGGGLYLGSIPITGNNVTFKSSQGTKTELRHIYMVQRPWAGITLLASILLISMGIASAAIGFYTLAPDILTSLSALANESQWFDTMKEGTTFDGDDKAAALKKRLVRLGDVKRFEDTGYIALGTIDTDVGGVGQLSTDRSYR